MKESMLDAPDVGWQDVAFLKPAAEQVRPDMTTGVHTRTLRTV
jgi:hypothetical protein